MNKTIGDWKDDFAEIEEIWNEPEPHFVCLITPEAFGYSVIVSFFLYIFWNEPKFHFVCLITPEVF